MKYFCIKDFNNFNNLGKIILKGDMVKVGVSTFDYKSNDIFYYDRIRKSVGVIYDIDDNIIEEYFITLAQWREKQINSILDEDYRRRHINM